MPVNSTPDPQSPEPRASIRMDARLDATTQAKVDDLAQYFHQPQAAVVCHIMHWGLSYRRAEMRDGGASEGPVRHLYLNVDTALHAQVEQAVTAAGMDIAPWLRTMVRQITIDDFPASWHEATLEERSQEERSHDSQIYDTRFMLRLDKTSQTKLEQLISHLRASKAQIICQLILQATLEDFPRSWQMNTEARHIRQAPRDAMGRDRGRRR